MAKISSFIICETINPPMSPQSPSTLVAPEVVLRPPYVPGSISFGIAVGIIGIDLNEDNQLYFIISDPEGNVLQKSDNGIIPKVVDEDSMPAEYHGVMLNVDIRNLPIPMDGEYVLRVYVNDECAGEEIIPIFKRGGKVLS